MNTIPTCQSKLPPLNKHVFNSYPALGTHNDPPQSKKFIFFRKVIIVIGIEGLQPSTYFKILCNQNRMFHENMTTLTILRISLKLKPFLECLYF